MATNAQISSYLKKMCSDSEKSGEEPELSWIAWQYLLRNACVMFLLWDKQEQISIEMRE